MWYQASPLLLFNKMEQEVYSVKEASTPAERERIFKLRYEVLRQPWNQPENTSSDELDDTAINAFIEDAHQNVIACGRLQENPGRIGQVRYMAVSPAFQGKGLGKKILVFLEQKAAESGLKSVQLQARENAVPFYKQCGYTVNEPTFLLWGLIQHYLMEKPVGAVESNTQA
jgi:N-acetylglutamate synthase-like GNAT family acetyltransferase